MSLEEILTEGGGEIQFFPCVGEVEICLNLNYVARIQESVDRQRWCLRYGESVDHACLQDDALCSQGKTVLSPYISGI